MKVYAYPADQFGCGHYRIRWPAEAVRDLGVDVEIIAANEDTQIGATLNRDGTIRDVFFPDDADVIVLQRPTHKFLASAIPIIRSKGTAVVVDMDDDLRTIHPSNPAFAMIHPKNGSMHSWSSASDACRDATVVTVSTPALRRRYGAHGRCRVLENGVPASFLAVEHEDSEVVGWGGSVHSHPNDLQTVGNAIANLIRQGMKFEVIGSGDDVARVMMLRDHPDATGVIEFYDWPFAIAKLGIGIAPLADTVFNAAKSWLKPLEYSAVGVPWVASSRTEYARLAKLGGGIAVNKPREWERELKNLLASPARRQELSEQGRETARSLTIESRAEQWYEVWNYAMNLQRGNIPVGVAQ